MIERVLQLAEIGVLLVICGVLGAIRARMPAQGDGTAKKTGGESASRLVSGRKRRAKRFTDRSGAWIDAREGRKKEG